MKAAKTSVAFGLLAFLLVLMPELSCAQAKGSSLLFDFEDAPAPTSSQCQPPPAPLIDLYFESIYDPSSKNSSVIDPGAYSAYMTATKETSRFESRLASMANSYSKAHGSNAADARCVQDWLFIWAQADGLNGKANRHGEMVRKWILATIGSAWLQVRKEPPLDPRKTSVIEAWLKRAANRVRHDFPAHDARKSRMNNHLYWAAWAVMVTGLAIDVPEYYEWALKRALRGVRDIRPDGTLKLEMDRGQKAINYHSYAATPLFMMAEIAAENGYDLYEENNQGLFRLARRIISGLSDPSYFQRNSGAKQDLSRVLTSSSLVWLEPYYKRSKDPKALLLLQQFRPVTQSRIGGNATLLLKQNGLFKIGFHSIDK